MINSMITDGRAWKQQTSYTTTACYIFPPKRTKKKKPTAENSSGVMNKEVNVIISSYK